MRTPGSSIPRIATAMALLLAVAWMSPLQVRAELRHSAAAESGAASSTKSSPKAVKTSSHPNPEAQAPAADATPADATPADATPADAAPSSSAPTTTAADASPTGHHHSNFSKTGPGPQGKLVQRSPAMSERLYQHLKGLYMSPYCPGLTLGSCGSEGARLLREDLREWVFEGHTKADITSYMIATFGDEIMGRPPLHGSSLLVWVAPVLVLLFGLAWSIRWIRRNSRRWGKTVETLHEAEPVAEVDPELEARLEAEVRARSR
jgi:cytochrome c-type biogenesis protein CcmH/NrfF